MVWGLGLLIFNYDELNGYDLRFQLRSKQPIDSNIVILNISKNDWDIATNPRYSSLLRSARPLSDSYFWSTALWNTIFKTLFREKAKLVTVDLFFDRSIPLSWSTENSFKLPNVIWRANLDERLGSKLPRFAINIIEKSSRSERSLLNVGLGYINLGEDNVARQYKKSSTFIPLKDLADKTATLFKTNAGSYLPKNIRPFINYRGPAGTYPTLELNDLLLLNFPEDFFKDKIVLVGSNSMDSHFVKTPLGYMTRTEYDANVIDNLLNDLWVKRFPAYFYLVYLFLIALFCFFILGSFRQGLSISCLILLAIGAAAFSIILFDLYAIWVPIVSPLSVIVLAYIILMNQLLSESEYLAWTTKKKEESLREINELKNNFVSLFSHDLKTPLAKIHAISNRLMQNKELSSDPLKLELEKIQKETTELDRHIQSILQVTRIEAGEFNLNITPNDINEIIKNCIHNIQPLAAEKNITITFTDEPLYSIELDASLVTEVFINILDNSIKYCPAGSKIDIFSRETENNEVEVLFSDNGPGVPEKEQSSVFDKFYRSKANPLDKKGTGLGLYLVRYFIEIHDGSVELESSSNQGTSFLITLPYEHNEKG